MDLNSFKCLDGDGFKWIQKVSNVLMVMDSKTVIFIYQYSFLYENWF